MLGDDERRAYLDLFRSRKDPHEREAVRKRIQDDCKKVKYCPHCNEYNGAIKKVVGQALRVVHDKYNPKVVPEHVLNELIEDFDFAC